MAAETQSQRLEKKVDALIESVSDIRSTQSRLADQMTADKRLADQLNGFMQQALARLEGEIAQERANTKTLIEEERKVRDTDIKGIKATLGKIAFALFTAVLTLIGSGLAYLLFTSRGK